MKYHLHMVSSLNDTQLYIDSFMHTAVVLKYLQIVSVTNTVTLLLKIACVVPHCACAAIPPELTCPLL